jgi:hypothetical protein
MSATDGTRRELPARPSKEHLRKQAKRLADRQSLGLAQAQRKIAAGYGSAGAFCARGMRSKALAATATRPCG